MSEEGSSAAFTKKGPNGETVANFALHRQVRAVQRAGDSRQSKADNRLACLLFNPQQEWVRQQHFFRATTVSQDVGYLTLGYNYITFEQSLQRVLERVGIADKDFSVEVIAFGAKARVKIPERDYLAAREQMNAAYTAAQQVLQPGEGAAR